MRTGLLSMLVVGMMVTSCSDRVEAQALASPTSQGLRIDWAVEPARGQWQTVCGHIYNDTPVAPREIRLLVEGRDTSDRIIDSRITYVLGYIAPWGRTYFCSTATAGAARYAVTILGAQWAGDR